MKSAFADPSTFEPGYALIYRTKAESDTLSTYIPIDQCTTNGPGYGIIFHAMARIQQTMQRISRVHAGGCFPPMGLEIWSPKKISKIFKDFQNLKESQKNSKIFKISKISKFSEDFQNFKKSQKILKIFKISKNLKDFQRFSNFF